MERAAGARVGSYRLESLLGRGANAEVWAASRGDGSGVALKFLSTPAAPDSQDFRRLEREGRTLTRIPHPNIVRILEVFQAADRTPVLVIERLDGQSLQTRLEQGGPMDASALADFLLPVVSAVGTAHAHGVVHRDLKPANVFLVSDGSVKVLDFGLAKMLDDRSTTALTVTGSVLGTPLYMAPEQVLSGRTVDHRIDEWAIGMIAYECLVGHHPIEADSTAEVLRKLVRASFPPLRSVVADVPVDIAALVDRLLARDPEDRPADLREVFEVLRRQARSEAPSFGPPGETRLRQGAAGTVETSLRGQVVEDPSGPSEFRAAEAVDGRFVIDCEVGAGGMGRIYRARDRVDGGIVALKIVARNDMGAAERFVREATVLSEISHPAIVRYVAHGTTPEGGRYLAMEWLEGEDLGRLFKRRLQRAGKDSVRANGARTEETTIVARFAADLLPPHQGLLSIDEALVLARRTAAAVAELHGRGIVHRDIKPANLFVVGGAIDQTKLLDFGTARLTAPVQSVTGTGMLVGTPSYMSPEQASGRADIGPEADVWAIGCVLYQALVGRAPFEGAHLMAILAKIVAEDPIPVSRLRGDVPPDLDALITRLLSKEPEDRPRDGRALLEALDVLAAPAPSEGEVSSTIPPSAPSLTGIERRIHCVLLAADRSNRVDWTGLGDVLHPLGARVSRLADGSLLVTAAHGSLPKDQAARAARVALRVASREPTLAVSLALGHGEGIDRPLGGDVIDRAARELSLARAGQIRVDDRTATLLDARFVVEQTLHGAYLMSERATEETRTLLGKPTKWVGRRRELATLLGAFEESSEEGICRAILVTAAAGMGKSRLRYELLREIARRGTRVEVLSGQGDSLSAGSPFVMIAPAIRASAKILDGEPLETRREKLRRRLARSVSATDLDRITAFLGELIGVPFPDENDDSLRAARKDPMLLGDLMRTAWEDWLAAECKRAPVLLVLEDLHWGDLPSVKYVDAALSRLREQPFLVLALARPEVHTVFPSLWQRREMEELRLHALSRRASTDLIRNALGDGLSNQTVDAIVERAGGNAFYLEELIRTVAEGGGQALPESVLGMVQTRLDALGNEAKRVLRAGSVFGEVFWAGGVEALVGETSGAFDVGEWLNELVAREVITKRDSARLPTEAEYKFRHALVRDGAYDMLTPSDRQLGHLLAGRWLESVGEQDALVLAEHFMRGEDGRSAARWYRRAAEQALEGNDLEAVIDRSERAIVASPTGEEEIGALRALQSIAAYWKSSYAESRRFGEFALDLLTEGSPDWFRAAGSAIVASARLGDYASVDRWFDRAAGATAAPEARAEQLICLCRGTFQLIFNARFDSADRVLERIASLARDADEVDALTLAQVNHVQGVRAAHVGDVATFLGYLETAVEAFDRAGDARNVSLERTTVAWCYAEVGDFSRAETLCRENMAYCERIGAQQAVTYGKVNLGYILTGAGNHAEAKRVLEQAVEECRTVNNLRLEGWARAHLTAIEHAAGRHDAEEEHARVATELLAASPGLRAWALSTHARARLATGDAPSAVRYAREAMSILEDLGGLLQGESLPPLLLAKSLEASGDTARARVAADDAKTRIERRAARLGRDDWVRSFLALPESRETIALARRWKA